MNTLSQKNDSLIAPGGGVWSKKAAYQVSNNPQFVENPTLLAAFLRDYLSQEKQVLLPLHNIYGGNVSDTLKAITKLIDMGENIQIVDVVKQPVKHVLCGVPGQNIGDIQSVYSHPQALLQCGEK